MWQIKRSILLDLINSAENYLPSEFLCFLGGNKKSEKITEIVFLPTNTSKDAASINEYSIPFDETIIGTLHSHPNGSPNPSKEDKKFFRKYSINIILGWPYSIENTAFFNEKGEKIEVIFE